MRKYNLKKLTFTAILACISLVAFTLENLLPPLILPGARFGFSNVFVLFALVVFGKKSAYAIVLVKGILGSVFSGNLMQIAYSLPSNILALTLEILILSRHKSFSIVCASVVGSITAGIVQNVVFCLTTLTLGYLIYLPYLSLIAMFTGAIIGLIVFMAIKLLPERIFFESLKENDVDNKR